MTTRLRPALVLLAALALGCAGTSRRPAERAALAELLLGRYENAYREVRKGLAEHPGDPRLLKLEKALRPRALVDRARRLTFDERNEEALAVLARALELAPDYEPALAWRRKVRAKIGERLTDEGLVALGYGELDKALARFQEALGYAPGSRRAKRGMQDVARRFQERRKEAEEHFREAVRARQFLDWERVYYEASWAVELDPDRKDALDLELTAAAELAAKTRRIADDLAAAKSWRAAARLYLEAADYAAEAGLGWADAARRQAETMEREAKGRDTIRRCQAAIARRDFAAAERALREAEKLCLLDRTPLGRLANDLRLARLEALVERARALQREGRLAQAARSYDAAAKLDPDGVWAQRARNLREDLARARRLYDQGFRAMEEGKLEEAMAAWREIMAFAPGYKDTSRRLVLARELYAERKRHGRR